MSEEIPAEVAKIRADRAERAKLKAAGQWPPPAAAPSKKAPATKTKKKKK